MLRNVYFTNVPMYLRTTCKAAAATAAAGGGAAGVPRKSLYSLMSAAAEVRSAAWGTAIGGGGGAEVARQVVNIPFRLIRENGSSGFRQFSALNEFSKQVKGEVESNPKFQQSIKELNEKVGGMKEDLKARTKQTTAKLYKHMDGIWTDAEATTKKVSANVKEKMSAAKEEVKVTFRLGKEEPSGSTSSSTNSSTGASGSNAASEAENSQSSKTSNSKESAGLYETLFCKFKSTVSFNSHKFAEPFQKLKEAKILDLAKKGYYVVRDELSSSSTRRRHMQYASSSVSKEGRSTKTDIVVITSKQSQLGKKWEAFKEKMRHHPIFKRISGLSEPVVAKSQELAEDMQEQWETSDHPIVHKIQDLNDAVFGETTIGLSFKEIRQRDPSFSLPDFVAEVQDMIRPTLDAYIKGDVETLKKNCSSEVIERCKAEHMAYESQGIFFDNKILHISDVDVREVKMMGATPIIIIVFQTQQVYCVRDREGSVVEGGKDTIQSVYYAWAMQQIDVEELGKDALYPIWRLREIQQFNVQALI